MVKRITCVSLVVASVGLLIACDDDRSDRGASIAARSSTVAGAPIAPAGTTPGSTVSPSNVPMPTLPAPGTEPPISTPDDDDATVDGIAIWSLELTSELTAESQSFTALVMRLGCHGGKTAPVDGPEIEIGDTEVVVTFTADPPPGAQTCPGNDLVPVAVDLGEPIGDRPLLDGACQPGSPALETAYCPTGGDRRKSTAFAWMENGPITSAPTADLLSTYCESASALAGERPEAYVGSQQHRADIYKLVAIAPPELKAPLATFASFLISGAINPADPDSNLTENWPDDVQAAIDVITTFNAASC